MIYSDNINAELAEFRKLMADVDKTLNEDAAKRSSYYRTRNGRLLEYDVYDTVCRCAAGTIFDKTIQLVSGQRFPDIVVARYFGIEVKTTQEDHWTSTGSSILESTRVKDVVYIYLTFGKLGGKIQFRSRPYWECMDEIVVTHYPRYRIDMTLKQGETIFDKMGVPYDELQVMDNPVRPVAQYYKKQLTEGETLWWADNDYDDSFSLPAKVRLWSALSPEEKNRLTVLGYCLFPEVLASKYNRYSLWLVTARGIVNNNVRDGFSAGGKSNFLVPVYGAIKAPAAFGRIQKYRHQIERTLNELNEKTLQACWNKQSIAQDRLEQWSKLVVSHTKDVIAPEVCMMILKTIFGNNQ